MFLNIETSKEANKQTINKHRNKTKTTLLRLLKTETKKETTHN